MVLLILKSKTALAICNQLSASLVAGCCNARQVLRFPTREYRQRETRGFFVGLVLRHF
jgi:hypothetical protein